MNIILKMRKNNNYNVVLIILIFICPILITSCFSDGIFWFDREGMDRIYNPIYEKNELNIFAKMDISKFDSIYIHLYIPNNKLNKNKDYKLYRIDYFWNNQFWLYHEKDLFNITDFYRLSINKNEMIDNTPIIKEFQNKWIELLKNNHNSNNNIIGRSNFTNSEDTLLINKSNDEYYYCATLLFLNSKKKEGVTFEIYCNEVSIDSHDGSKRWAFSFLSFPRNAASSFTNKFINNILEYKNKKIDLQNDSLKLLNKPLLGKYTWYREDNINVAPTEKLQR